MKLLTTTALALCMLVFVGCSDDKAPDADAATITNATNKVQANVSGMTCTGCSGAIEAAVAAVDGVTACQADHASGDVKIALTDDADAQATKAEVEKVIAGLNDGQFTVNTIAVSTGDVQAEAKTCPEGCTKECCTKAEGKTQAKTCPEGCTKECCKKAEAEGVIKTIKEEVNEAAKDIEIPAIGGE